MLARHYPTYAGQRDLQWINIMWPLYGWLKVQRVAREYSEIQDAEIEKKHPHGTLAYYRNPAYQKKQKNAIYIASEFLFDGLDIPGCGYFPRLNKKLLLTLERHCSAPTKWELPAFFMRREPKYRPTYLRKKFEERGPDDDKPICYVTIPDIGQEFVCDYRPDCEEWLKSLFEWWPTVGCC